MLEVVGDEKVLPGTVELEEALVLSVQDVVKECDVGAEAFGEPLARKGGEIAKGAETPEG